MNIIPALCIIKYISICHQHKQIAVFKQCFGHYHWQFYQLMVSHENFRIKLFFKYLNMAVISLHWKYVTAHFTQSLQYSIALLHSSVCKYDVQRLRAEFNFKKS